MPAPSMKECIDACLECHRICLETVQYCLRKGGEHANPAQVSLLQDCASICETSAQFMISGSDLYVKTCETCAVVCLRAEESCDRFRNDLQLIRCADICSRCAEACERMHEQAAA